MTSWSGGVRTGGWRVKNRSKFSALRPHYERGRKELVVGGHNTKQEKQNWMWLSPSLPFHHLSEAVSMTSNVSNRKCKILMTFRNALGLPTFGFCSS